MIREDTIADEGEIMKENLFFALSKLTKLIDLGIDIAGEGFKRLLSSTTLQEEGDRWRTKKRIAASKNRLL